MINHGSIRGGENLKALFVTGELSDPKICSTSSYLFLDLDVFFKIILVVVEGSINISIS